MNHALYLDLISDNEKYLAVIVLASIYLTVLILTSIYWNKLGEGGKKLYLLNATHNIES
jgi:hypothetical protein